MHKRLLGNAPCSWGMLEFEEAKGSEPIGYRQMLDELAEAGYSGTELGDWGYMPTDPASLNGELKQRKLDMLGAFVPVALKHSNAHTEGISVAVKTARLLAAVAGTTAPYLVLADANGIVPERTKLAGRVHPGVSLTPQEWKTFAEGANQLAKAVFDETGLRTVFHHHCAGYVETPAEIETLLKMTDPQLLGLVFDTGHFAYGAGEQGADMVTFLDRFVDRIWHIHCKDCSPTVARQARINESDYFAALRHGVFCELGKGSVDFAALFQWLDARKYNGYFVVEQDVLPGMGSPKQSAQRNFDYLRSIDQVLA